VHTRASPHAARRRAGRSGAAFIVSRVSTAPTDCPGCGRATRTVFGRCPQCGFGKEARRIGATPRTLRGGSFWDGLDIGLELGFPALIVVPVLALVAGVLLFVLGIELIVVAAVVALLVLLALGLAALA
jgi:hypothetical protein